MPMETVIFLLLVATVVVLALINAFLLGRFYLINKKFNHILESGKIKDLKTLFLKQKEKNEQLDQELQKAFLKIEDLENISKRTIQKTGVVRFNSFNEKGGNQSFVIALLDDKNDGFVITSIFIKEGNRVFAKDVKKGKSSYLLSKEEVQAISKAIDSKI